MQLSLGVALFFTLSGFLVYAPWARGAPPRPARFYALRAARILPLPRLLSVRPLAYMGTLSYGISLWHFPVLLALQARDRLPGSFAATCLLVGATSIALAALTWHGLERPILLSVRGGRSAGARPSPRAVPGSG